MKSRLVLDPKALRHVRTRRGLTLKQVAECLRKNLEQTAESLTNMYERIERTGITSPRTAATLAAHLDVPVEQLLGASSDDGDIGSWWFESSGDDGGGVMVQGRSRLSARLRAALESVSDHLATEGLRFEAHVYSWPTEYRLTLTKRDGQEESVWWSVRPVKRTTSGISWLGFTDWERDHLKDWFLDFAFGLADRVHIDDDQVPPNEEMLAYELREFRHADNEQVPHVARSRFYRSEPALKRAVLALLRKSEARHLYLASGERSIALAAVDGSMHADIVRRWRTHEHDEWRRAPWAAHSVRAMHRGVRDWINSVLPEAQFYEFDSLTKQFIPIESGRDELARTV